MADDSVRGPGVAGLTEVPGQAAEKDMEFEFKTSDGLRDGSGMADGLRCDAGGAGGGRAGTTGRCCTDPYLHRGRGNVYNLDRLVLLVEVA